MLHEDEHLYIVDSHPNWPTNPGYLHLILTHVQPISATSYARASETINVAIIKVIFEVGVLEKASRDLGNLDFHQSVVNETLNLSLRTVR